jgi:dienelactone hydrolase
MDWLGEPKTESSVTERDFSLVCDGRRVPGVLFSGDAPAGRPIALLGHGGTLDKRADYLVGVARRLVRNFGVSAISIDGPGHGERRTEIATDARSMQKAFEAAWTDPKVTDEIVADWRASLDAVSSEISPGRVGYFGLSMGTMMGLPLCVAEPRIEACVLGLMGYWGLNRDRLREDAPRHSIPTRFLMQWDDEVVPRKTALALFDDLGSKKKAMHAHPGPHVAVPPAEMKDVADYLAAHLGA